MSAGEKKPGKQKVNLEGLETKQVVRVFFLQPIDPKLINEATDLTKLNLTEVVLIQKNNKSRNAGAFMPAGGQKRDDESLEDAAEREALEETHLIFSKLEKLNAVQEYAFMEDGKLVGRVSHFFVGNLYAPPFDVPYALDNDVDKIEKFVRFSRQELKELIDGDKMKGGKIFDSLNADKEARKKVGTKASQQEIHAVQKEISEKLMQAEVEKKLSVLSLLLSSNFSPKDLDTAVVESFNDLLIEFQLDGIGILEKYKKVSKFWEKYIRRLVTYEDLRVVLNFSNLQDILLDLKEYQKKPGDTLPTIHMMFPIMFGLNFDIRFLDLFKREPHLEKIYAMSRILFLYNNMKSGERGAASERLLRRILDKKEGEIGENEMVEYFKKLGFLSLEFEATFKSLADEIDVFFQDLQKQSQISPALASLAHINQVEDKPFERILKLAFGSQDRQVQFEAQRKLLLVHMAFEAKSYYQQITNKGIVELDDLEEKLEVSPVIDKETGEKNLLIIIIKNHPNM
jgi:8-oxo-dGTP pyrophosphatase MutT (NUDIX family)